MDVAYERLVAGRAEAFASDDILLSGYIATRPEGRNFGIVGDLRTVAWKLGVADSSRGTPSLTASDLPGIVEGWLAWESTYLR